MAGELPVANEQELASGCWNGSDVDKLDTRLEQSLSELTQATAHLGSECLESDFRRRPDACGTSPNPLDLAEIMMTEISLSL